MLKWDRDDRRRRRLDWLGSLWRLDVEKTLETVDTNRQFTNLLNQFVELLVRNFHDCRRA
jgi:hypothetical protein